MLSVHSNAWMCMLHASAKRQRVHVRGFVLRAPVAGGQKFIEGGVLFKFAVDWQRIYGDDRLAAKAAALELASLNAVSRAQVPRLHAPMSALFHIDGHCVVAAALVPVAGESTLVYGSADAARTVHSSSPAGRALMQQLAARLGLAVHPVRDAHGLVHALPVAADVELHVSAVDGRFYLLDLARLLPPLPPRRRPVGRADYLTRMFRAEFLRRHCGPGRALPALSSDAFSPFGREGKQQLEADVRRAADYLHRTVVPAAAKEFSQLGARDGRSVEVASWLHTRGVNLRYLGDVFLLCTSAQGKARLLPELVGRALKTYVRRWLRSTSRRQVSGCVRVCMHVCMCA